MSNSVTGNRFIEIVVRSGLLTSDLLRPYESVDLSQIGADAEAAIASRLVADQLLTPYQAQQLLTGKTKGFFLVDKYKVLDLLGSGGMGQVFLCEHMVLQRLVAVKILQRAAAEWSSGGQSAAVERFIREARAIAVLDHPNIVRVHDMERSGSIPFMVMEYVDGTNLHQIAKQGGPLAVERAAHYIRQAAAGLQHAHEHGLVHRDIKPGNLLLDRSGVVKLLDLGLARFGRDRAANDNVTARYNEQHAVVGTADYMSPEQGIDSNVVDIRSDIYGLGATFYFLLTGRGPFEGEPLAQKMLGHQVREPVPIRSVRQEVPSALADVVARMTAKSPEDRFSTPAEVADALRPWTTNILRPPPVEEMPRLSPDAYHIGLSSGRDRPAWAPESTPTSDSAAFSVDTPPMSQAQTAGLPPQVIASPEPTASLHPGQVPGRPVHSTSPLVPRGPSGRRATAYVIGAVIGGAALLVAGLVWWAVSANRGPSGASGRPTPPAPQAGTTTGEPPVPAGGVVLTGSGSTFIKPAMDFWAPLYERQTGVKIKYDGIGSGRGVDNMIDRVLDFGCTDAPMTEAQLAKARSYFGEVVHIPLALGAVVATYNLPDVPGRLRFTGDVLADIFLGKIRKWNHPALAASNPGVTLPDLDIAVVHRSDSSGTTFIWTDFLNKASAEWQAKVGVGTSVRWPIGEEGEKNDGIAKAVSRKVGAVGYVELSFALERNLNVGLVKNQAGNYVEPTLESVTAAVHASLQTIPDDLRYSLTDALGADSYPIAGTAWAVLYVRQTGPRGSELVRFLQWTAREGQVHLSKLRYAPLPPRLVARIDEKLAKVQVRN